MQYDAQTNLSDYNNFSPRAAVAYGAGRGLVLRGGWGMFFERLPLNRVAEQRRYDGVQQCEIVIDKPLSRTRSPARCARPSRRSA